MNPGGSIKDRIGISMIERGREARRHLSPATPWSRRPPVIPASDSRWSRRRKATKLILVLPDKMSQEKIFNLRAMGAEVILTRSDVGRGHPEYYQDLGRRLAEEQGAYFINQFGNPDNPLAHEKTTGARDSRTRSTATSTRSCSV